MLGKEVLYRLGISGAAFRAHQLEKLNAMGYKPRYVDPDVFIRTEVKPNALK